MKIDKINENIIISEKIHDCYLMYTSKEYYLFKPENNSYTAVKINISDNPDEVETSILNIDIKNDGIDKVSNNSSFNGELKFLMLHLELIGLDTEKQFDFIMESLYDLAEIYGGFKDRFKRFDEIDNEKIIATIETISKDIDRSKKDSVIGELYSAFKHRKGVEKAIRDLGNYLNIECGVILRINSHDLYKLDEINNGYDSTSIDEIIAELTEIFGDKNLFKTKDVENAVDFISDRLKPEYNIVKFNNGLYDMQQHKMIKPDKPVFTLIESPFAFNPDAKPVEIYYDNDDDSKSTNIKKFLYSAFERESPAETEKEIKGVLQVIGYLFTSGNAYNVLIFLIGIGGAGKGTLATIIAEIFKGKTTQLDFSEIEKDIHATSILINSHLNIVRESDDGIVENNKHYKILSGNDPIPVNPKHEKRYELPADEVPKSIMNYNNLPNFKDPDISLLQRFVLIEFRKSFRNTDDDVRNLAKIITESAENMEWLIYNSLQAYKEMVLNGDDFILRLSEKETLELVYKHSQPLNYLIRKLILKHDAAAYETDVELSAESVNGESEFTTPYIIADELNRLIVYLAKKEGIQIPLDKKTGKASSRKLLNAIKDEFELFDYYLTTANGSPKKYTTVNKRINGKQQRVYPELIKTDKYDSLYKEMVETEKANERLDEFNAIMKKHMQ